MSRWTIGVVVAAAAVVGVWAGVNCGPTPSALTEWCPDDPTVQWCPEGEDVCSAPYQCISYCMTHHPDGNVPSSGMGAWCDDARLPAYGDFCEDHMDVAGCAAWCDAHQGECGGSGDGDADTDSDSDTDGDGDADTDADGDADADDDGCTSNDDCADIAASQCNTDTGDCEPCGDDTHCTHLTATPACDGGTCYLCSETNADACPAETPHCLAADHSCVACFENLHCTEITASRCDDATHACAACSDDPHCEHLTGTEHCGDGTCVQCTSYNHCEISGGLVCNYSTSLCVNACEPCINDDACSDVLGDGFTCAWDRIGISRCLQSPPASGCERPWVERAIDIIGGGTADLCAPPETTTCLGVVEFGSESECPDDCGEDGESDDAFCISNTYCSYFCSDSETHTDCPDGSSCSGVPLACRTD